MKFSMTGQDKDDCLIEVTPWVGLGLTVIAPCLSFQFLLPVYILWKVGFFSETRNVIESKQCMNNYSMVLCQSEIQGYRLI
jgi:hypothetical protein